MKQEQVIDKVAVLGAGVMGSGIATVCLGADCQVMMIDVNSEALERAKTSIHKNLIKSHEKGLLKSTPQEAIERLTISSDFGVLSPAQLVIEAVSEDIKIKEKVFSSLNTYANPEALIASNTSALRISDLEKLYKNSGNVLGMHFFNPAHIMKLVELICTESTSESAYQKARQFVLQLGKEPVKVQESYGFVVNRVLIPMINEAALLYEEGVASADDIDKAMKLGANHPIGPLALADLIGLDVCLAIMETLKSGFNSDKYAPAPILKKYVTAGKLGKKSGEGFFKYN